MSATASRSGLNETLQRPPTFDDNKLATHAQVSLSRLDTCRGNPEQGRKGAIYTLTL